MTQFAAIDVEFCRWSFQIVILRSRNFCQHSSLIEGSIVKPHKSNSLVQKKIQQGLCSEKRKHHNCSFFIVFVCKWCSQYSLHGNLVVVALHWFLKYSIPKLNDVLHAVLSTDLGEQRSLKFPIRQLGSLNEMKIICSMIDRKPFIACGFCVVKILPVIGYNKINIPDIFQVFTLK